MAKYAENFLRDINAEILRIVLRGRENDASKPKPNTSTQSSSAMTPCTVLVPPFTYERIEGQKTIPYSTPCLRIPPKLNTHFSTNTHHHRKNSQLSDLLLRDTVFKDYLGEYPLFHPLLEVKFLPYNN